MVRSMMTRKGLVERITRFERSGRLKEKSVSHVLNFCENLHNITIEWIMKRSENIYKI